MCGPDHPAPDEDYRTHASISALLEDGRYSIDEFPVTFTHQSGEVYTYKSCIAYKKDAPPRPLVLVLPNYAGLKQFDKDQALFLAKCGYVGLAVDLFRETESYTYADRNPTVEVKDGEVAGQFASRFSRTVGATASNYVNMKDAKLRQAFIQMSQPGWSPEKNPITVAQAQGLAHFKAAFAAYHGCLKEKADWRNLMARNLELGKQHPAAHPKWAGAIGYCFGGQSILEMVRMGCENLQAVVSFHGLLQSEPENMLQDPNFDGTVNKQGCVDKHAQTCKVLIENAEHDDHVSPESIELFTKEMNDAGVDWQIHHHSGAHHGWALPPGVWATEYDELVDARSTTNMLELFREVFPEHPPLPVDVNASGAPLYAAVDARLLPAGRVGGGSMGWWISKALIANSALDFVVGTAAVATGATGTLIPGVSRTAAARTGVARHVGWSFLLHGAIRLLAGLNFTGAAPMRQLAIVSYVIELVTYGQQAALGVLQSSRIRGMIGIPAIMVYLLTTTSDKNKKRKLLRDGKITKKE